MLGSRRPADSGPHCRHCKSPDRRRTLRENAGRLVDDGPAFSRSVRRHFGRMLEDLLMTVQRSLHLGAVGGIAVQNLIVGDQALGTLGQEDLVTELHRLALLAPLDQM